MKTTIAYKKHGAGIIYIILTILGTGAFIFGLCENTIQLAVFGFILTAVSAGLAIQYLSLPSDIIVLSDDSTLILPKGVTIPLNSVNDVSYRRASAKGIQYRWGSVTLSTLYGKYKFGFVADCEAVSKRLTQLIYEEKHRNGEQQ